MTVHRGTPLRFAAAGLLLLVAAPVSSAQQLAATLRNQVDLGTSAVDQFSQPFTVAGLSGLTFAGGTRWLAVMDNSDKLVELSVSFNPDGSITTASITAGIRLSQVRDHEDVVFTTPARNSVLVCEEDTPQVHEYSLSAATLGQLLQSLSVPAVFASRRANFGFESLSRRADGSELWTCNEEALTVDGPLSTQTTGTTVRILRYTLAGNTATPAQQYAYLTQPIHAPVISSARSGVSALVSLPSGRLLALERSFGFSLVSPFQSRLYEADLSGATDVSAAPFQAGLIGQVYTPVSKRQMYIGGLTNLEGLALGPALAGGGFALLGIVDDGDPISVNRLIAFQLTGPVLPPPCPVDRDGDGSVTPADLAVFVTDWFTSLAQGTLAGDFNADGAVQPADVAAFVAAWISAVISGC